MANHKSALKRVKQSEQRRVRNRARRTRLKNVVKEFEASLQPGSMDQAGDRLRAAISVIDQTAQKGVIHRNKAARKISRLVRRFNKVTESQRG